MKQIEIDGVLYDVDVEQAIKQKLITPAFVPKRVGQHFQNQASYNVYVLSVFGGSRREAVLVNIATGSCYQGPVPVSNLEALTKEEWEAVSGHSKNFLPVTLGITIVSEKS